MALKSTIFKAEITISDMDRHYYHTHHLTIARHPSETDERMMIRLLAFSLHANESLTFGRGLSDELEPDLLQKNLQDDIELWIDLGQPEEKRLKRTCHQSKQVILYTYQTRAAEIWWKQNKNKLNKLKNLVAYNIGEKSVTDLTKMAKRTMRLQCAIEDEHIWFGNDDVNIEIQRHQWL